MASRLETKHTCNLRFLVLKHGEVSFRVALVPFAFQARLTSSLPCPVPVSWWMGGG